MSASPPWWSIVRREKQQQAETHPETLAAAARALFDGIQQAAVQPNYRLRLDNGIDYTAERWRDQWAEWIHVNLGANPIVSVDLGRAAMRDTSAGRLPAIPYTLTRKDGSTLQGTVPMLYDPLTDRWGGFTGLDWHLKKQ